jgi:hypothetical protein
MPKRKPLCWRTDRVGNRRIRGLTHFREADGGALWTPYIQDYRDGV